MLSTDFSHDDRNRCARPAGTLTAVRAVIGGAVLALAAIGCGATTTTTVGPSPLKCDPTLTASAPIGPSTGTATVSLFTSPECTWTASTASTWVTKITPQSGQGSGQIQLEISANPTPAVREADFIVNDVHLTIRQAASPCLYEVSPPPTTVSAAAGGAALAFTVTAASACAWDVVSQVPWISPTAGGSGMGNGVANLAVGANVGPARQGTVTVAGRIFTVSQPGCSYGIVTPPALSWARGGGAGNVGVVTDAGCTWTASSNASWITITSGVSGSGSGGMGFSVGANVGLQRMGTVTVAGHSLSLTQASGCSVVRIDPTLREFDNNLFDFGIVTVTMSAPDCPWTAVVSPPVAWIKMLKDSGTGLDNAMQYLVSPKSGSQRFGMIEISSDAPPSATHTVSQRP